MNDVAKLLTVTIPYPSYIPRSRGIYAVDKLGGYVRILVTQDEQELIEEAARKVGISKSSFGRWCVVQTAVMILKGDGNEHVGEVVRSWGSDPEPDGTVG